MKVEINGETYSAEIISEGVIELFDSDSLDDFESMGRLFVDEDGIVYDIIPSAGKIVLGKVVNNMKREDIKKPNPETSDKVSKLINDLVKKKPSDDFFKKIEGDNE